MPELPPQDDPPRVSTAEAEDVQGWKQMPVFRGAVLLELMQGVWRNDEVVANWMDTEVVPIP